MLPPAAQKLAISLYHGVLGKHGHVCCSMLACSSTAHVVAAPSAVMPALIMYAPVVAGVQDGECEEAIQHACDLLPIQLIQVADDLTVGVGGKLLVGALHGRE
jgi:hypothetical protein